MTKIAIHMGMGDFCTIMVAFRMAMTMGSCMGMHPHYVYPLVTIFLFLCIIHFLSPLCQGRLLEYSCINNYKPSQLWLIKTAGTVAAASETGN
jgi:hypothetical protein